MTKKKALNFKTRIFKYELPFAGEGLFRQGDNFWEYLFNAVAARGFNGVVFYGAGHPFEYILDYRGFPQAAADSLTARLKRQKAFNRILAHAHARGVQTFVQHYVSHFPYTIAKHAGLDIRDGGFARLAGYDLPIINDYIRYCYREVFRQCPDLDGLYFNFESSGSACRHVLATAVHECNRMHKKPVFVFRLWGMRDFEGMRTVVGAYKGRSIFGHKIAERADVYHMPVADSRAHEWKKAVPGIEYMHLAGPCHNCATNLSSQVWGDYDFVQALLADSIRKKADSLSFHIQEDILGARYCTFDPGRTSFGLYNIMHLEAASDFFHKRRKTIAERHAFMADWLQVPAAAGRAAYEAITASSKPTPLADQQFLVTSAFEGYWLPPRSSLIQNPFILMPVDQLRRSRELPPEFPSWVDKTREFPCGKANETQYIIDYVDPGKPVASRNPAVIAREIRTACGRALKWGQAYRRLAGRTKGDHLMHYLQINNAIGMWAYHNIIAGINFFGVYFARTRAAVIRGLKKGIAALEAAGRIERNPVHLRNIIRVFFYYSRDMTSELKAARRALRLASAAPIPMDAYQAYLASRREYNEIMRWFRAGYNHGPRERRRAHLLLDRALRSARQSLELLRAPGHGRHVRAVRSWIRFIEDEIAALTPRAMKVSAPAMDQPFIPLTHEQCFRWGEYYSNDFAEFFQAGDFYRNRDRLSFRAAYNRDGLVVTLREDGFDVRQREAQWEKFRGVGDDRGFLRVFIAPDLKALAQQGKGSLLDFAITPKGEGAFLTAGVAATVPVKLKARFRHTKDSWETEVRIPFKLIGRKPRQGQTWGFNVLSNTAIVVNHQNSWSRMYENMSANPLVLGRITFA